MAFDSVLDGQEIAFLSNRGDEKQPQIYRIPFQGGEARPLTDLLGEIDSFEWSPDGKQFVCQFRKKDQAVIEREADEQKKKLGVVSRRITRVFYKLDGVGFLPEERWHIWTIDASSGQAKQLTDSDIYDELAPCWSPDGEQIAFCSNRSASPDLDPFAIDLFVMPATGGEPRQIETAPGEKFTLCFSPDGKWLAYSGLVGTRQFWRNTNLWVVPTDGTTTARDLTARFDFNVTNWTINDLPAGLPPWLPPVWSADGRRLYFQVTRHGSTVLRSITLDGDDPRLQGVVEDQGVVLTFSFDQAHARCAYLQATMSDPGQVWIQDMATGQRRQLTQVNKPLLQARNLGEIEEVWFKGPAGNELQGWLLKPPDFDATKPYPSILQIHGGPSCQYGHAIMHEFYYLAAHGYVVYFCNPRGSWGYGEAHSRATWNNWGAPAYEDLMAWADFVQQKPYIDEERMGVTGGSYGGYMTNWIIAHTDRFKAAVTQRCISNLLSAYGSTDLSVFCHMVFGDEAPWENFENYWRQSPLKYIGQAKTPTLIIHSEGDLRCPLAEGEQLFVALKHLGVDTEMVLFPDESHGLSRSGRTDRRIERLNHILRWFDRYLKGENE